MAYESASWVLYAVLAICMFDFTDACYTPDIINYVFSGKLSICRNVLQLDHLAADTRTLAPEPHRNSELG